MYCTGVNIFAFKKLLWLSKNRDMYKTFPFSSLTKTFFGSLTKIPYGSLIKIPFSSSVKAPFCINNIL